MRKRDPRAMLFRLNKDEQAMLADWMLQGRTYAECRDLVKERFGLEVKSLDSFSRFYQDVCAPLVLASGRDMKARVAGIGEVRNDLRSGSLKINDNPET